MANATVARADLADGRSSIFSLGDGRMGVWVRLTGAAASYETGGQPIPLANIPLSIVEEAWVQGTLEKELGAYAGAAIGPMRVTVATPSAPKMVCYNAGTGAETSNGGSTASVDELVLLIGRP